MIFQHKRTLYFLLTESLSRRYPQKHHTDKEYENPLVLLHILDYTLVPKSFNRSFGVFTDLIQSKASFIQSKASGIFSISLLRKKKGGGVGRMRQIPITREGYEALKRELERLKKEERPKVIAEIERARAFGDLSENAEYHAAKEKQAFIEAKIRELEDKLARVVIVEDIPQDGKVCFGCKVKLKDLDSGRVLEYQIVGGEEADPAIGKISVHSPVARALIGKEEGDEVEVVVPAGKRRYLILEVNP